MSALHEILRQRLTAICRKEGLLGETVRVCATPLSTEEAIGTPEDKDFPLQKGKERLLQATFRDARGQAFTDHYGNYEGTLESLLATPPANTFRRAVFVAALNAVLKHLELIGNTVHCRDEDPRACASELAPQLRERFGAVKITQVGFQPRMVEALAPLFPLRLLDLDPDNLGHTKFGVPVEGPETASDAVAWAELLLVTGTTLVNDTIGDFLLDKPVLFYGTTIAGAAHLMGWERFCPKSS
jgi:hypothetical protein